MMAHTVNIFLLARFQYSGFTCVRAYKYYGTSSTIDWYKTLKDEKYFKYISIRKVPIFVFFVGVLLREK